MVPFEKDLSTPFNCNGVEISKAYYNLVISIRDVKLFCAGLKPHRYWRLKDVKTYFGVKGNKENVLKQLELMKKQYIEWFQ